MSTDKTLADVQPGGRVRLGGHDEKPPQELPELIVTRGDGIPLPDQAAGIEEFKRQCLRRIEAEYPHLSAQPSPGGQGDALVTDEMVQAACKVWAETPGQGEDWMRSALEAALAARQPVAEGYEVWAQNAENVAAELTDERAIKALRFAARGIRCAARQPVESEENVAADTYWTLAEMIEPHVQREGTNPDGELPASVHDSVAILLEHWLRTRQPVGYSGVRTCGDERPCINCYSDQGDCLGPAPSQDPTHQPVLQEPMAWISRIRCVGPEYGKEIYGKLPVQSLNPLYYEHIPLYAAPAQAVDLEQFRPAVCALGLYAEEPEDVDEAKRLLALIDSQAVGNG